MSTVRNIAKDLEIKEVPKPARYEGIPKGYLCDSKGVRSLGEDDNPEWIALKPVVVKAVSRDESSSNWGVLVWWLDHDDQPHEVAIPKRLFHIQGTELAQQLADGGLPIVPRKEKKLLTYLAQFNVKERLTAASCTGWLRESFVLPTEAINEPEGQRIVYQPAGLGSITRSIRRNGTLESWQAGMLSASPMVKFLVCASLSAPVRYKLNVEAGGFHIFNLTSHGKTTALQAAASAWGNGLDPAIGGGEDTYIKRWNATANALEALAESHNDLPMVVDEIGEGDSREFGRTIYRMISGQGRGRAGRSGELRDSKSWRVTILSAGELAIADFIESGGAKVKGGQLVRIVDLDLSQTPALFSGADQANAMKQHCAHHFGHAGPEMLRRVPDLAQGWKTFEQTVMGAAATPIAQRVRTRFTLVAHTGLLAVRAGILPWTEEAIIQCTQLAYSTWHGQVSTISDTDRGVTAVMDFLLAHESRFETGNESLPVRDRAGWKRDGYFHFTPAAFKGACAGADTTKVKQVLKDEGYLHTSKGLNARISVGGTSTNVVSVKAELMARSLNSTGTTGITGISPENTWPAADTPADVQGVSGNIGDGADTPKPLGAIQGVSPETGKNTGRIPAIPPIPPASDMPASKYREVF